MPITFGDQSQNKPFVIFSGVDPHISAARLSRTRVDINNSRVSIDGAKAVSDSFEDFRRAATKCWFVCLDAVFTVWERFHKPTSRHSPRFSVYLICEYPACPFQPFASDRVQDWICDGFSIFSDDYMTQISSSSIASMQSMYWLRILIMGLWNRLSRHQERSVPFHWFVSRSRRQ